MNWGGDSMRSSVIRPEDVRPGIISFDELNLDEGLPLDQQLGELQEDLLQVEYPQALILDVGWYPEFTRSGSFVVRVIRKPDGWDNPMVEKRCSTLPELRAIVRDLACIAADG